MGRTDVKVYGQNGNADALQAILDGTMTATSWQSGYDEGMHKKYCQYSYKTEKM